MNRNPHLAPLIDHTDGWHPASETPPSSWWLILHNDRVAEEHPDRYYIGRYVSQGWCDLRGRAADPTHWHILPDPVTIG